MLMYALIAIGIAAVILITRWIVISFFLKKVTTKNQQTQRRPINPPAESEEESDGKPDGVPEAPVLYWSLRICGMAVVVVLAIIAGATWNVNLYRGAVVFDGGPTFLALEVMYLLLSLKSVGLDELGGALFYGKALVRLSAGLHFLPFGFMQLGPATRLVQEFQAPGEPEKVFKGPDSEPLPPGMVRPIRAVSRAPKDDEKKILDAQMTLTLSFIVQYAVRSIFDFLANFGSFEEVEKQLRDIGESTLSEIVSENTPGEFIEKQRKINEHLATKIHERFMNSGVEIISTRLIPPDISHEVSQALVGIPEARANAQSAVIRAEATKIVRTKEGEGAANARLAFLTAEAEGGKKMKDSLGVTGDAVLAAEAVNGLSDKTDVLVVGAEGGMKDVMGLVKGAQAALAAKGGPA